MNTIIEIIKNLNAETMVDLVIAIAILAVLDIFSPLFSYLILKVFNLDKSKKQIKNNPFYMPLKAFFKVTGVYVAILFVRPTFELTDEFMNLVTKIYKVIVTITIANSLANSMTKKSRFIRAIRDKSEKEINDASAKMMIRVIKVLIYVVATFIVFYEIGYDLSGFVKSKPAGERLLELTKEVLGKEKPDSWLDWREDEPEWIQFKFQKNEFDLEKLRNAVIENDFIISKEILMKCRV